MIKLTKSSFSLVPEGTHVFVITAVEYKTQFGKIEIHMQTADGYKHIERFTLIKNNGEPNAVALSIFSDFARKAMHDMSLPDDFELNEQDLVGKFIECEIVHEDVTNDEGKTNTFARVKKRYMADGFADEGVVPTATAPAPVKPAPVKKKVDLSAIFGKK